MIVNGFLIINSLAGPSWIQCQTCGQEAQYSNQGFAINAAHNAKCCQPKLTVEQTEQRQAEFEAACPDNDNGLVKGIDY